MAFTLTKRSYLFLLFQLLTLLLGICMFAVSLPLVYLIDRRSKLLFHTKNPLQNNMADSDSH